jgi:hypothetical protein
MVNYEKSRKKLEKALKFVYFDFLKFQLNKKIDLKSKIKNKRCKDWFDLRSKI